MADNERSIQASPEGKSSAKNTSWRESLLAARHGRGAAEVTEAVRITETAIYERLQELRDSSGHDDELSEIKAATDELLAIKTRKFGWPRP